MKNNNSKKCHLSETGENYFEHLLVSLVISFWIMVAGVTLLFHAAFPFIFASKASKHIKKINQVMQKRTEILLERRRKKESKND